MINLPVTFPRYLTYPGWETNENEYLAFSILATVLASHL